MKKSIVIYFSHSGENYVNGKIINLEKGNTEVVAEKIQNLTDSDIFKIETLEKYPLNYYDTTEVVKKELKQNIKPALKNNKDVSEYDVIYLGYPNWWGTMPMAIFNFLESSNMEGKIIAPFCTHEGSGLGRSTNDIQKLCPDSRVTKGLAIRGSEVSERDNEIKKWLNQIAKL